MEDKRGDNVAVSRMPSRQMTSNLDFVSYSRIKSFSKYTARATVVHDDAQLHIRSAWKPFFDNTSVTIFTS